MLQEELCSVVEASGASLEKERHDQLLTALRALLLSRKNPFGDIKSDGTVKTALENLGLGDGSGRYSKTVVFSSSGSYTWPADVKRIDVILTAGAAVAVDVTRRTQIRHFQGLAEEPEVLFLPLFMRQTTMPGQGPIQ